MLAFGLAVAPPQTEVVAPHLGFVRTWLRFDPLVDLVEAEAAPFFERLPDLSASVVGHSMGGLIWLTILDRRPEWRRRVTSLVLLGCPVRGAELATILDRQGWTIGRDLAVDRSDLGARVAASVPTLSVAGDLLLASDGTITYRSAEVEGARFVCLPRESHAGLVKSERVQRLVRAFVAGPHPPETDLPAVIRRLEAIPGLSPGAPVAGFGGARVAILFRDGANVRLRHPAFGAMQLFVASARGDCLWAGEVPRYRAGDVRVALEEIERQAGDALAGRAGGR